MAECERQARPELNGPSLNTLRAIRTLRWLLKNHDYAHLGVQAAQTERKP